MGKTFPGAVLCLQQERNGSLGESLGKIAREEKHFCAKISYKTLIGKHQDLGISHFVQMRQHFKYGTNSFAEFVCESKKIKCDPPPFIPQFKTAVTGNVV